MKINKVEYIKDYKLMLIFNDKVAKVVDLETMIKSSRGIFLPLRNLDYFKQVSLDDCQLSICWPNGADICPDVIYKMGKEVKTLVRKSTKRSKSHPLDLSEKPQTQIAAKPKHLSQ
jgi:hypothetical protein